MDIVGSSDVVSVLIVESFLIDTRWITTCEVTIGRNVGEKFGAYSGPVQKCKLDLSFRFLKKKIK